jgi:nucleoside-diphosphate-sugar epimerase
MRILVTGHLGYIGPHVVEILSEQGCHVTGVDLNLYAESEIYPTALPRESWQADTFDLTPADLEGFDAVVHLAAISNDAMGVLDPALTWRVNYEGTLHVARCAKQAGVARFLFSSSCSVYGHSGDTPVDETTPTGPLSVYARTKVRAEESLSALADASFSPTFLRNATAYGISPRFRSDLVLNNLVASAVAGGDIRLLSDGTSWRPLVHCRDIARTFARLLEAPTHQVHDQAFNVGANPETYTVRQVAEIVQDLMPQCGISHADGASGDPRNYRVDFGKLKRTFPDFRMSSTLRTGAHELTRHLETDHLARATLTDDRFVRLKVLQKKMERGEVPAYFATRDSALQLAG